MWDSDLHEIDADPGETLIRIKSMQIRNPDLGATKQR
jgi:hypothetical protein